MPSQILKTAVFAQRGEGTYTTRVAGSITEVEKDEWDRLAKGNAYAGYAWLKTVEETYTGSAIPRYILIERNGELVGAVPCHILRPDGRSISLDNAMLGRLKKYVAPLGISFLPAFVCGSFRSYGNHLLIQSDLDHKLRERVAYDLLEAVEQEASKEGLSVLIPGAMNHETGLLRLLRQKGYHTTSTAPLNYMDIEWNTFGGYLQYMKSISKKASKNIRNSHHVTPIISPSYRTPIHCRPCSSHDRS